MGTRVEYEVRGGIAHITLARPEKRNAFDDLAISELSSYIEDAESDKRVRAISIAGKGTAFSAGADLDYLLKLSNNSESENFRDSLALKNLLLQIYSSRKLTCAVVRGPALAGAFGLVLACDIVIASESARFGFTEVKIGFVPAIVLNFALRKLRESDVRRLVLTGAIIDSAEAVRIGLTSEIVPDAKIDEFTSRFFEEFAAGTSPKAVALTKEILSSVREMNLFEALRFSADVNVASRSTEDFRKGISSFLKKEKPRWS